MNDSPSPWHERPGSSTPVHAAVAAFDAAWQSAAANGEVVPRLEVVLESIPKAERSACLRELLVIELEWRAKRGENPAVSDYLPRFPAEVGTIQSIFEECGTIALQDRVPKGFEKETHDLLTGAALAAKPASGQSLKPGTELGNYTILRLIGQGGMGAVYHAEHRRMRRKVALKLIAPAAVQHPDVLLRFHREVQAVSRLEHPNIVTAYDADQAGDIHFLVMQYVDGDDLSTMVRKHGPFTIDMAMRCLMQTARGLEYAHQQGIVHRDIKPSNLIVAKNGVVKVLDMGLARLEESLTGGAADDQKLTGTGNIMGTIDFMAPEQALDAKEADQRADIYSLGCTFYYLITGQMLHTGDTMMKRILAHRFNPVPSLSTVRDDTPAWVDAIFQKMVAKNVADRYQTMTELLTAIAPYVASGLSGPETDVSVPGRWSLSEKPSHLRPAAALLVEVPGTEPAVADVTAELTSPSTDFETLFKVIAAERPLLAAQGNPARSDAAGEAPLRPHRRLLGIAAAAAFGLFAALAAVIYVQTDTGTFVIETADQEVTVALHDKGIRVHDVKTDRTFTLQPGRHDVKSGEYEIDVAELPSGIEVNTKKFQLKRGGREILTVTLTKAEAKSPAPVAKSSSEPRPIDFSAERAAAERLLAVGAKVIGKVNGEWRALIAGTALPDEEFTVVDLRLQDLPNLIDSDLAPVAKLSCLEVLLLSDLPQLTSAGVAQIAPAARLLQTFVIANVPVADGALEDIITRSPDLRALVVGFNTRVTDDVLMRFAKRKSLQNVSELEFQPLTDRSLAQLEFMPQLKRLNCGLEISDAGLKSLHHFPNLESLSIPKTVGFEGFREIAKLPKLKQLNMTELQLTPAIVDALRSVPLLEEMTLYNAAPVELDSSRTQLLLSLSQVRTLDMRGNVRPDAAGMELLAKATHITKLFVARANDHDLELLAANTALQFLELHGSQASPETIAKYRTQRPAVDLTVDGKKYPAGKSTP
jgi:serine/threonine protein kinase